MVAADLAMAGHDDLARVYRDWLLVLQAARKHHVRLFLAGDATDRESTCEGSSCLCDAGGSKVWTAVGDGAVHGGDDEHVATSDEAVHGVAKK